jgi:hypothetical protein
MIGGFRYESLRFSASNKEFLNQPFSALTTCLNVFGSTLFQIIGFVQNVAENFSVFFEENLF